MDDSTVIAAIEAQFLMGYWWVSPEVAADGKTITDFTWGEDSVRQALHVPLNNVWEQRVLELEAQGLASFHVYGPPVRLHVDGTPYEVPGWRDEPRERWGSVSIRARGILKLADLYGRPYVRYGESPALLVHWDLVQAEDKAQRHNAQWDEEYPELALLRDAWELQDYRRRYDPDEIKEIEEEGGDI